MKRTASTIMDVHTFKYEGDTVIVAFDKKGKSKAHMSLFMPLTQSPVDPDRDDLAWFDRHTRELSVIAIMVATDLREVSNA